MESSVENYNAKLDEVLRRLEHVETLLLMGEVFPDEDEILVIKNYLTMVGRAETEFIPLEEIDNEL
jgi:hypothetical protein